jgi:hypothetical protein
MLMKTSLRRDCQAAPSRRIPPAIVGISGLAVEEGRATADMMAAST